jgi:hypothetical protein
MEGGKHSAADVVAKAQAVLTEPAASYVRCRLLPPNTLPGNIKVGVSLRVLHENT